MELQYVILIFVPLIILSLIIQYWLSKGQETERLRRQHTDVPKLERMGLPVIQDIDALAAVLGLSTKRLTWLLDRRAPDEETGISCHYVDKRIAKAGGGRRTLLIPKRELKAVQRWILREILEKVPLHAAAHGFRKGRSISTNAVPHTGKAVVVCCDLQDFFPSIRYPRVRGAFQMLGYSWDVAAALALLCTTRLPGSRKRALPQGAPTSPALSNIIAYTLDCRLAGLADKLGFIYTRYADDCTFSAADPDAELGPLIRLVGKIIRSERFVLHPSKLRIHRAGTRQRVTGLVVNAGVSVPRAERRRLRAILHRAQFSGIEAQNRICHSNFVDYLYGKIAFVRMINPRHAASLEHALNNTVMLPLGAEEPATAPTPAPATPPVDPAGYMPGPENIGF